MGYAGVKHWWILKAALQLCKRRTIKLDDKDNGFTTINARLGTCSEQSLAVL